MNITTLTQSSLSLTAGAPLTVTLSSALSGPPGLTGGTGDTGKAGNDGDVGPPGSALIDDAAVSLVSAWSSEKVASLPGVNFDKASPGAIGAVSPGWVGATKLTLAGGTAVADTPLINGTQTWNNAAIPFSGYKLNITDTASAAGSNLLDMQVGGVSKFKVEKNGNLHLDSGASGASLVGAFGTTRLTMGINLVSVAVLAGATTVYTLGTAGFAIPMSLGIRFSDSTYADTLNVHLLPEGAGKLAQRNGTNPQAFRVYNTYTDASNCESAVFDWTTTANTLTVGTKKLGTGAARAMNVIAGAGLTLESGADHISIKAGSGAGQNILFYVADGLKWRIDSTGALWTHIDNAVDVGYAANRVRTMYVGTSVRGGAAGQLSLGAPEEGLKQAYFDYTNTATVGAVTINKAVGRVNIAAAGTSVVVTNSYCTAAAFVSVQLMTVDGTAKSAVVVPANGSFTITLNAACTSQVAIGFSIVNTN